MQLTPEIHLVGSGRNGLGLTDAYDCNVYMLDGGSECALIDTGAGYDSRPLLDEIARSGVGLPRIRHVLLTHKHADHSGAAAELRRLSGARIYGTSATAAAISDAEAFNHGLQRARSVGSYPADYIFRGAEVDVVVGDGDTVAVGNLEVRVVDTPGHCVGHCSFVMSTARGTCLFSGDALFPGGMILLLPTADCSVAECLASVETLAAMQIDALMAGHQAPILSNADRHVRLALDRIREGKLPLQLM